MASHPSPYDLPSPVHSKRARPRPPRTASFLAFTNLREQRTQLRQSYENLVALANAQEALRQTRRMVWRDRGEPATELGTIEECFEHALRGGTRAGGLAFGIRSGVNLFLLLFRIMKTPKKARASLVLHALFGEDSFRFAAMLGTFVGVYKLLLNALPLVTPKKLDIAGLKDWTPPLFPSRSGVVTPKAWFDDDAKQLLLESGMEEEALKSPKGESEKPKVKTTLSQQAEFHQKLIRKRSSWWHAFLGGAVGGGLGVLMEKRDRRLGIAQQMFVRGLQGSWNAFSDRKGIKIPFGAVWIFSLCCGQIMYSWLLRPDTIPRSYSAWITEAAKAPVPSVRLNRTIVREGIADEGVMKDMAHLIDWKRTTPHNRAAMQHELSIMQATNGEQTLYPFVSCSALHPWIDSCWMVQVDRFWEVFRWMFPIYGALHFVPTLLFKRKSWAREPLQMATRTLLGTGRSASFLGVFVVIYQGWLCFRKNIFDYLQSLPVNSPTRIMFLRNLLKAFVTSKLHFWLCGSASGLSLFIEAERRRPELTMYVMPKALESVWVAARGRGLVSRIESGDGLLCALGMGLVMSTYQNHPQHLSGLVRRVLYQFIGPN